MILNDWNGIECYRSQTSVVEAIIAESKGPAGPDFDGIHLFKSAEAVDAHSTNASKHLSCMQVS